MLYSDCLGEQKSIPRIFHVTSIHGVVPSDSRDLCAPLTRELLVLVNHFNAEVWYGAVL